MLKTIASAGAIVAAATILHAADTVKINGLEVQVANTNFQLSPTSEEKGSDNVTLAMMLTWDKKNIMKEPVYMPVKLNGRNVREVSVTDVNGKTYKQDTDFYVDAVSGTLVMLDREFKPVKATVSYTCLKERYDAIFRKNGKLVLVQGKERRTDAEEYVPDLPGSKRIANLYVCGNKVQVSYESVPKNVVTISKELKDTLASLKKGDRIKVLGYGDSITAVQNGHVTFSPGGPNRDRLEGFFSRFPNDTQKLVPRWDRPGMNGIFVKAGWSWGFVNALEKNYGVEVEWLNSAIGSTTSRDGINEERLAGSLQAKPDVVLIAFGMNERWSNDTYDNVCLLIDRFRANGAKAVIVVSVPRCQSTPPTKVNAQLKKAAQDKGASYVDLEKIDTGINPTHYCASNRYNHPGVRELKFYRAALAKLAKKQRK